MNQDDDLERLFSWLQTPEIRYREFAGAREVTDVVATWQVSSNIAGEARPPQETVPIAPEPPPPVHTAAESAEPPPPIAPPSPVQREPAIIVPAPPPAARPVEAGPFALGAAGRGVATQPEEARAPPVVAPAPPPTPAPPLATPAAAGSPLGGTHREPVGNPTTPPAPAASDGQQGAHSLASVFSRLSGGRATTPDPRDRMRHIPGLGPTTGRPR